jgi:hypothetical protein
MLAIEATQAHVNAARNETLVILIILLDPPSITIKCQKQNAGTSSMASDPIPVASSANLQQKDYKARMKGRQHCEEDHHWPPSENSAVDKSG